MAEILIVDDDHHLRQGFQRLLDAEGYETRTAASAEEALNLMREKMPQCVVMDVRMPGMDGLEALKRMRALEGCPPVVIMTAYSTTETAIEATRLGAFDYMLKPFDIPQVLELLQRALAAGESQRRHGAQSAEEALGEEDDIRLVGHTPPMQELYKAIGRVAPTDALVLIRGESGTGKELVANAIWRYSPRSRRPFSVINCVAIPDTLLESELFGYERGAFTGAQHRRIGRIEQAAGGTIFLDEIGDMPPGIQAKLLRLLQEKQIQRLGGHDSIDVDVRIIAATNANLEQAVADGRFREDLYYRLKVVTLRTPPLRERREDIPALAAFLLHRQAAELHRPDPGLEEEALRYLAGLDWPGNVRELSNALQKALVFNSGAPVSIRDLQLVLDSPAAHPPAAGLSINGNGDTGPAPGVRRSRRHRERLPRRGSSCRRRPGSCWRTSQRRTAQPGQHRHGLPPVRRSFALRHLHGHHGQGRGARGPAPVPGQPLAGGPPAGPFPPHPAGAHGKIRPEDRDPHQRRMRAAGQTPVTASMPALSQGLPVSGGPSFLPVGTAAFPAPPARMSRPKTSRRTCERLPPPCSAAPSAPRHSPNGPPGDGTFPRRTVLRHGKAIFPGQRAQKKAPPRRAAPGKVRTGRTYLFRQQASSTLKKAAALAPHTGQLSQGPSWV